MATASRGLRPSETEAQLPAELGCAEIWGGNRPANVPILLPGLRGKLFSHPCDGGRGGDIHFLSVCSAGMLSRVCLADVAGHGEAVSTVSSEIHGLLRRYVNSPDEGRLLSELNRRLAGREPGWMTTAVAVTYVTSERRLSLSYAGHPPVWISRAANRKWEPLPAAATRPDGEHYVNLPLGVHANTEFPRRELQVEPGDRLLILSDGVLEAPAGDELFGDRLLAQTLNEQPDAAPGELIDRIVAALEAHAPRAGLVHDDVTLLAMEFGPGPDGPAAWNKLKQRIPGQSEREAPAARSG